MANEETARTLGEVMKDALGSALETFEAAADVVAASHDLALAIGRLRRVAVGPGDAGLAGRPVADQAREIGALETTKTSGDEEPLPALQNGASEGMKRCTKCGQQKPLEAFHRHAKHPDGRQNACKVCRAARRRSASQASGSQSAAGGTQRCKLCQEDKPLEEFQNAPYGKKKHTCRACMSARIRAAQKKGSKAKSDRKHLIKERAEAHLRSELMEETDR